MKRPARDLLGLLAACSLCASAAAVARLALPAARRGRHRRPSGCKVTDPYLELRTGPGRGFPVFFVAARQRVDRDRAALHRLVQGAHRRRQGRLGAPPPARDHAHRSGRPEDLPRHRARRLPDPPRAARRRLGPLQVGADAEALGQLPVLRDADASKARSARCRACSPAPTSGTSTCMAEPWSDQRLSPFFGIGVGRFKNFPNLSLVGATDHRREARQRRDRRALLPDRALRAARRLHALHRFRLRHRAPANTGPSPRGISFFF